MLRILLLDDNPDDRALALRELERAFSDLSVEQITEPRGLERAFQAGEFDLVVTDYQLRWSDGLAVLRAVKGRYPECPVLMFTNTGSEEVAVEAMKSGLDDYILKSPRHYHRLAVAVRSAWEHAQARRKAAGLEIRLQALLNRLNVGVFRVTPSGQLLEGNAAFLRLLGASSVEEAAGIARDALYPQQAAQEQRSTPGSLPTESHSPHEREVQLRRADGSLAWVWVNETLSVLDGKTFLDGLIEDITERKRAEEENARLLAEVREAAARQRAFLRDVMASVTEGRLRLCDDPDDLPRPLAPASDEIALAPGTLRALRSRVEKVAAQNGHAPERWQDLITAVGEASMNAVVHGGGGTARVCSAPSGTVQVWIRDQGTGIALDRLHRATLERGFTTAGSLGHGFWMMLRTCDRVWLLTGPSGTTVVLEQDRTPPEPAWLRAQ